MFGINSSLTGTGSLLRNDRRVSVVKARQCCGRPATAPDAIECVPFRDVDVSAKIRKLDVRGDENNQEAEGEPKL